MTMNLTIPHDLINQAAKATDIDRAVLPIITHLDPNKEQDLGGEAGAWFSNVRDDWPTMSEDERGYTLMRFSEFICNCYRTV